MPIAFAAATLCGVTALAAADGAPATHATPAPSGSPRLSQWQRAQQEKFANSAPADEYFGRLKMSYLGINNVFRDAAISSGDHTTDPKIATRIADAENALDAWAAKYPRDPQLARSYYLAVSVERKIWIKANQDRAWTYFQRIVQLFPTTYFGKLLQRDLAIGFTEHYYADAVPCATPSPTPAPTETPAPTPTPTATPRSRGRRAPTPSPSPAPSPTPTPEPTPTPLPSPTITTLAPNYRVEIIPVPCTPYATPSPAPSPTPSPSPSPIPSASP